MKIKNWMKLIGVGVAVIALAACAHKRSAQNPSAINDENAAYNNEAQTSGLGEESGFGDEGGNAGQRLSKRVYYFDFDSNVVRSEDRAAIVANANYLVSHSNTKVLLEGHTDPRGSREYNIGLGERRAKAVAEILTANGVNPAQIRIVSYGAEKLASYGHSEADYQKDRRVVLVYLRR